jgi:hypothetical protein
MVGFHGLVQLSRVFVPVAIVGQESYPASVLKVSQALCGALVPATLGCAGASPSISRAEVIHAQKVAYERGHLDGRAWDQARAARSLEIARQENSQLRSRLLEAERRATEVEHRASVQRAATEHLYSCHHQLELAQRRMSELEAVVATQSASLSSSTFAPRDSRRASQPSSARDPSCDPNYSPCVPIASDVDCAGGSGNGPAYVSGPIQVVGTDIYGLDRDGDGVACQ